MKKIAASELRATLVDTGLPNGVANVVSRTLLTGVCQIVEMLLDSCPHVQGSSMSTEWCLATTALFAVPMTDSKSIPSFVFHVTSLSVHLIDRPRRWPTPSLKRSRATHHP